MFTISSPASTAAWLNLTRNFGAREQSAALGTRRVPLHRSWQHRRAGYVAATRTNIARAYSQEPIAGCSAAFRRRSSNVLPRIVVKRGRGASSGTISPFTRSCSQLSLQTPCWSGSCGDSLWPRLGAWYLDHGMVARDGVARAASSKTRALKTHGRILW
jgi:hypothetical protein